jgi:hypothetical protein
MLGHGAERATLQVNDERVFRRVLAEGDIGFGESWIAGDWHSEQPAELLTLLAENRAQLARAVHGSWLPLLGHRLRHLLRSNTRAGSKRNILAHYDLGNDFYKLWLDPSMSYSAALFGTDPQQSLQQAQRQKYLRLLDARPEARRHDPRSRLRLGRAGGDRRHRVRLPRAWHHAVAFAAGMVAGARAAQGLCRPGRIFADRLPRRARPNTTTSSRSRCSRRSASASGRAISRSCASA